MKSHRQGCTARWSSWERLNSLKSTSLSGSGPKISLPFLRGSDGKRTIPTARGINDESGSESAHCRFVGEISPFVCVSRTVMVRFSLELSRNPVDLLNGLALGRRFVSR